MIKRLIFISIISACSLLHAKLSFQLLTSPEGVVSPIQKWKIFANGSKVMINEKVIIDSESPSLSGSLSSAKGSINVFVCSTYNFNPEDFTYTLSIGDGKGGKSKWAYNELYRNFGPITPNGDTIQISGDEAILFIIDTTNLKLNPGKSLQFDSVTFENNNGKLEGGLRVSHYTNMGEAHKITGTESGLIPPVAGKSVEQKVGAIINNGDQIAIWREFDRGQGRFRGLQFSVVNAPE